MSRLSSLTTRGRLQTIERKVAFMLREKGCLEVRQTIIRRTLKKMEEELSASDHVEDVETLEDMIDNLFSISSDLESYRDHLESEIDKINRGLKTLAALKGKTGRSAFAAYVAEDVELSINNLTRARLYYDQVIETLKTLKDESV